MNLLGMLTSSPDLGDKSIRQIISIAGSGKLTDDSETSTEFREFLSSVQSNLLGRYASECLEESFPDSGLALQDIVNEVGRRLGFTVTNGRYRGRQGAPGHDGLWVLPNQHVLVVEVKTTTTFSIDLEVVARYRRELIRLGEVAEDLSSVLLVVGREDTGDLEAQVRGSKSAWDMRLITVEGLLRLMNLRESIEDPDALRRIYELLIPMEFTKLDAIVDLLFSTAEDVKVREEIAGEGEDEPVEAAGPSQGPKFIPVNFNELVAQRVANLLGSPLLKRTRASFSTANDRIRVICLASKRHERPSMTRYWFAFHPHQLEWLQSSGDGYVALGCGSPELVILIPIADLSSWLDGLGTTTKDGKTYWHIDVQQSDGQLSLSRRSGFPRVSLEGFAQRIAAQG